jgi:hypothetical protein
MQPTEERSAPLTQWWNPELLPHLPRPLSHINKTCRELIKVTKNLQIWVKAFPVYFSSRKIPVRFFVLFFRWYTIFVKKQLPQMKPVYCAYITIYTATFTCFHRIPIQRYPATIQGYRCLTYLAMLWNGSGTFSGQSDPAPVPSFLKWSFQVFV